MNTQLQNKTPYHYTFTYKKDGKTAYIGVDSSVKNYAEVASSLVERLGIETNEFALVNFFDETTEGATDVNSITFDGRSYELVKNTDLHDRLEDCTKFCDLAGRCGIMRYDHDMLICSLFTKESNYHFEAKVGPYVK